MTLRDSRNPLTRERVTEILSPFRSTLSAVPLYITIDKVTMRLCVEWFWLTIESTGVFDKCILCFQRAIREHDWCEMRILKSNTIFYFLFSVSELCILVESLAELSSGKYEFVVFPQASWILLKNRLIRIHFRLFAIDIFGDWSPVDVKGWYRTHLLRSPICFLSVFSLTFSLTFFLSTFCGRQSRHSPEGKDERAPHFESAVSVNENTNIALIASIQKALSPIRVTPAEHIEHRHQHGNHPSIAQSRSSVKSTGKGTPTTPAVIGYPQEWALLVFQKERLFI